MLVKYHVSNFLSFFEQQELKMTTGKVRSHEEHVYKSDNISLVKGSLIYGANAAGKSNLIKSIAFARNCIVRGVKNINTLSKHYKLNPDSLKNPTEFEFEILIEDKVYAYGFNLLLGSKEINEEWLYEVGKDDDILIFDRVQSFIKSNLKLDEADNQKLEVYKTDIKKNELFLEVLCDKNWQNDSYIFLKVFNWFKDDLLIIFPHTNEFIKEYYSSCNLQKYLEAFDTGITGIDFSKKKFDEISIPDEAKSHISNELSQLLANDPNNSDDTERKFCSINFGDNFFRAFIEENDLMVEELIFKHGKDGVMFKFEEESDGTKRLLELIPLLETVRCSPKVVIIDELERSLHPVLVNKFIDLLYENMENQKSQIIIATHESRLLDLDNIRRDEIWFTERNQNKGTQLYTLDEYNVRFDTKIDKAYLLGRYGGIPNIMGLKEEYSCEDNE